MFVQIGNTAFNPVHIARVQFDNSSVTLFFAVADIEGKALETYNTELVFIGARLDAFMAWWENYAEVRRMVVTAG